MWSHFFKITGFFVLGVFAVHFAYVKTPAQHRTVASEHEVVKPWYDASFKL